MQTNKTALTRLVSKRQIDLLVILAISIVCLITSFNSVESIRCYQCSSDEDKQNDSCATYESFDASMNTPIDCNGDDAVTPGTFCYKSIQQGLRGFPWDGRWRTVIRRCAQVTDRGISWGCDWGYDLRGVYWEECYCAEDGCNLAPAATDFTYLKVFIAFQAMIILLTLLRSF